MLNLTQHEFFFSSMLLNQRYQILFGVRRWEGVKDLKDFLVVTHYLSPVLSVKKKCREEYRNEFYELWRTR